MNKYFNISNNLIEDKRCLEADVAKGIGILLVLHGHTCATLLERVFIGSFHMPLFFFLSGLFLLRKDISLKSFLLQKSKSLLFPCLIFGLILSSYSTILDIIRRDESIPYGLRYIGLFINMRHNPYPGSLWFFPALFLVELIVYGLHKISHKKSFIIMCSLILAVIGLGVNYIYRKGLPWSLDIVLYCTIFTVLGYSVKDIIWKPRNLLTYVFIGLIFIISTYYNYRYLKLSVDLYSCRLGNYILFYISAFSGIYITIGISQFLKVSRVLRFYGQNSLIVYSLQFLFFLGVTIILNFITCDFLLGVIKTIIIALIMIPVINIINIHFKWMVGKF